MEFLFTYGLYTLAILLIVCGLAGTIVPALPGIPMIFIGGWIIAYIDDYQYIGMGTLIALCFRRLIGMVCESEFE